MHVTTLVPLVPSLTNTHLWLTKPPALNGAAVRCILRPRRQWPFYPNGSLLTPRRESTLTHGLEPPCTAAQLRPSRHTPFLFSVRVGNALPWDRSHSWENAHTHSCSRWVGGKTQQTILEFLPGVAGLQISDLNPRPAQKSPKGPNSGGPAKPRLAQAVAGNSGASLGCAAARNRHSLRGPLSQQAGGRLASAKL